MRIAFVSISNITACNKPLLEAGLTLPGFVARSKAIASLPHLGLLTLAGMTPEGHIVSYHEVPDAGGFHDIPHDLDLVAISSFTALIGEAYQLADRYRAAGVKVVMGGLHATQMPDEVLLHADAVIVGAGENSWLEVLEDAAAGRLKDRYGSATQGYDLRHAPMPAFHLLARPERYSRVTLQTSRGCPLHCEFCASSILIEPRYNRKPTEKVLAEIDAIQQIWPRPMLEFVDDNAFASASRAYWKDLLPEIARRRVRWFAESDISIAEDPELLTLMRRAGCMQVLIGLESPEPTGLDGLELRSNWKRQRWNRYVAAVKTIQRHGIRVIGCFIVGLDGHDTGIFEAIEVFAREAELFDVQITLPTPFPGTAFHERLKREGRLYSDGSWERCTLFDLNFEPHPLNREELERGFIDLSCRLYGPEATDWRKRTFLRYLRQSHQALRETAAGR